MPVFAGNFLNVAQSSVHRTKAHLVERRIRDVLEMQVNPPAEGK